MAVAMRGVISCDSVSVSRSIQLDSVSVALALVLGKWYTSMRGIQPVRFDNLHLTPT
jgi:hypothetical protein